MTSDEIRARIRVILENQRSAAEVPSSDQTPLELSSLEVVQLHDALETAFGLRIRATLVTQEHFGSIDSLAALIAGLDSSP